MVANSLWQHLTTAYIIKVTNLRIFFNTSRWLSWKILVSHRFHLLLLLNFHLIYLFYFFSNFAFLMYHWCKLVVCLHKKMNTSVAIIRDVHIIVYKNSHMDETDNFRPIYPYYQFGVTIARYAIHHQRAANIMFVQTSLRQY